MIEIPVGVKITPLVIEQRDKPSYEMIATLEEEKDDLLWYLDVWNFIEKGEYLEGTSSKENKAIRKFSA